jgi:tRNA modification GTPase
MPFSETIAAAATPPGESALALVRASGPLVPALAAAVLGRPAGQTPAPRHATFGHYHTLAGESLDQIVLTYYAAPASATGEDLLEIACHGNPLIIRRILDDLLARGCRPAQPGEFTRTAFLAGKLDLAQAEAVADLIRARSDGALRAARRQLDGELSRRVQEFSDTLLQIQAATEAYIDFPEEDLPAEDNAALRAKIAGLAAEIEKLLATARYGALLRDGASVVIAGPPNAGKSSLLNALLGRPRAIVSPTPGTTRDFLEETLSAGPYTIQVTDTAGLPEEVGRPKAEGRSQELEDRSQNSEVRIQNPPPSPCPTPNSELHTPHSTLQALPSPLPSPLCASASLCESSSDLSGPHSVFPAPRSPLPASPDPIEIEGVSMALEKISTADFLLLVLDSALPSPTLPRTLLDVIHPQNTLVIENKTDLSVSFSHDSFFPDIKHLRLSIKTGEGLAQLRSALVTALEASYALPHDDLILTSTRHADALRQTHAALTAALEKLETHAPAELLAAHLRDALTALAEIAGPLDNHAMLDRLFAQFCIGK